MRTLVCAEPGRLEYTSTAEPESHAGRAIIKVKRVGVCGTDLHAWAGDQPYFSYPRILGHELSGELTDATFAPGFEKGETVTIIPYFSCGDCVACRNGKPNACVQINVFGVHSDGGMREYISVPVSSLVHGDGLDADALALVEPLAIGAHAVRRCGLSEGMNVLVIGAGPIGMGTLEMVRLAGANAIAMDVNADRLNFCREKLGITRLLDARAQHLNTQLAEMTNGEMPRIVIDATGNQAAINNAFQYLSHGGVYILVGLQKKAISFSHPEFHKREATLGSSRNATRADFEKVMQYIKARSVLPENYITHRAPFDEVKDRFAGWKDPSAGVIKAMISVAD